MHRAAISRNHTAAVVKVDRKSFSQEHAEAQAEHVTAQLDHIKTGWTGSCGTE